MINTFTPLVSIVIPVYNGNNYLREAIDSALSQTYKKIEVIVVDDGSTDKTSEIARSYGDAIRYFYQPNKGVASALNTAIGNARGEYVSWLSHDDLYTKHKIQVQLEKLGDLSPDERNRAVVYSNYSLIDDSSRVFAARKIDELHDEEKVAEPLYAIFNGLIHGCTLLVPRPCYLEYGGFDESLFVSQDYDLWYRMLPHKKLIFLADSLVYSRVHAEQGSKTISGGSDERELEWIKRIRHLSQEQKSAIYGGTYLFYEKSRNHFKKARYTRVVKYLEREMRGLSVRDLSSILVSIIIPFHNRVDWTLEALKSAIDQTHRKVEVILVDDGSDESIKPLMALAQTDRRITLVANRGSRGAGGARNTGLDISKGEYIAFLDSDDLFEANKVERQLAFMVANGYSFCHTSYKLFQGSGESNRIDSGSRGYSFPEVIGGCSIACPTVMIHSDLIKNKGARFPEQYPQGQDVCFWITLSRIADCHGYNSYLSNVRRHESNVAYDTNKQIRGLQNIVHFTITNYLSEESLPYIAALNRKLAVALARKKGEINAGRSKASSQRKGSSIKKQIKSLLKKVWWRVSPLYRMTKSSRELLVRNRDFFVDLEKRSTAAINQNLESIALRLDVIERKLSDCSIDEFRLASVDQVGLDISADGARFVQPGATSGSIVELERSSSAFHNEMKKHILAVDTIIDIGVGLRPQAFFTPRLHICIEPYEQYREALRPYFPSRSNFIFLRDGALESLAVFDDNSVDSIFMLDVIEHLEKSEGLILLEQAERVARKQVIVYTPYGFYPMHYSGGQEKDAWGLDGTEFQEHKSGWYPEDFGEGWQFFVCKDCHEAFLEEERRLGKKYSALMAIKNLNKVLPASSEHAPEFVRANFLKSIEQGSLGS